VKHKKIIIIGAAVIGTLGILACSGAGNKDKPSSDGGLGAGSSSGPVTAAKDPDGFGEGTFAVGADIKAGIYASAVPDDSVNCYVEVSRDNTGSVDSIIHNDNLSPGSHALVQVSDGQYLKTSGCGDWASASATGPQSTTFTEGIFRVGNEIAPGQYTATVPSDSSNCYYSISKDGSMGISSIVKNDNLNAGARGLITVKAGQWLKADGCGTWTKQ
jgi:hypothetical protein